AARSEHAPRLGGEAFREAEVLEHLAGDDGVEARVLERERIVEVGPARLDPELRGLGERGPVDVDADDLVPLGVCLRQRPVAAAEVEHRLPGADPLAEERRALRLAEDEVLAPALAVVAAVRLLDLLEP